MVELDPTLAATVAANVRARREALGLSLDDLAREAGVAKSAVHAVERGDRPRLSLAVAVAIAKALSMTPGEILGDAAGRPAVTDAEAALLVCLRQHFTPRDPA